MSSVTRRLRRGLRYEMVRRTDARLIEGIVKPIRRSNDWHAEMAGLAPNADGVYEPVIYDGPPRDLHVEDLGSVVSPATTLDPVTFEPITYDPSEARMKR